MPKLSPDDFSKVEDDKIEENFGFVNPIGSKFTKKCIRKTLSSPYLNDGLGEPWAGHVNAMSFPNDFVNFDESKILANFGFAEPIGSKMNYNLFKICIYT